MSITPRALVAFTAATALSFTALATSAHADVGCNSMTNIASDIYKKVDELVLSTKACKTFKNCADAAAVAHMTEKLISYWNWAAGNSWAKIGPRRLDLDTDLKGNLVATGRLFVAATPSRKDRVTITLEETGGKAKVDVAVCIQRKGGKTSKLAELNFNADSSAKDMVGEGKAFTIKDAKGAIISVHLANRSPGKTFKYVLKAQ